MLCSQASLETLKGGTVIVLCPREDSLDNELGVLVDIQAALERRGKPYLMVYMGEPSAYQVPCWSLGRALLCLQTCRSCYGKPNQEAVH